ncbi:hypothetical protein [Micromonospora sp. NPDC050200]|uniref:hypothetical protein n=1 Tax=Micromonospora sp. NPDC050200 TaxID=3155664 RepID=UPI0033DFDB63
MMLVVSRAAAPLVLDPGQRELLDSLAKSRTAEHRLVQRAQVLLHAADGASRLAPSRVASDAVSLIGRRETMITSMPARRIRRMSCRTHPVSTRPPATGSPRVELAPAGVGPPEAACSRTGLNLTVRNVTTHTRHELTEQEGMKRLAAYSYLARLLDKSEIRRAESMTDG